MNKNYIVTNLIDEMKERMPHGQNLANYLADTYVWEKSPFTAGCAEKSRSLSMR